MTYYRTIHFSDTDAAGVVYFATLLSICHEAYENSLKTTGIDLKTFFTSSDMAIPIVHAEIDFYQPLFCGDTLQINLIGTKLNETDFEIIYNIFHESFLNKSVAQAKTKHVSINPQIRKRSPFSPLIIQWLEQISANVNQV